MSYLTTLREAGQDAQQLEMVYRAARQTGEQTAFADAAHTCYSEAPENLLYAAWHFRLLEPIDLPALKRAINWPLALLLAIPSGLIFWLLSDVERFHIYHNVPLLPLVGAALSACLIMSFLSLASGQDRGRVAVVTLGLAALVAYVILALRWLDNSIYVDHYAVLMIFHLALLSWAGIGLFLLWNNDTAENRFAFLTKSFEAIISGGLFLCAGVVFTLITLAMFQALGVTLPEAVHRLFVAGGAGLAPVLAVAMVYRPGVSPAQQEFGQGLSWLIATLLRLLLPLTLLALVVYLALIPFNFWEPFHNREVLIVYNAMLFAVIGLLVGVTPMHEADLAAAQRLWLRRGILAVSGLAVLVSLYTSAAILYRIGQGGLTPNRLTVIGWNLVNIAILFLLLYKQGRAQPEEWLAAMRESVRLGTTIYVVWGLLVIIAIPLFF